MNRDKVWKNFDLGEELDVAGTFIYNGLRTFHEMETFEHSDVIFEFLYALSVGIERLLKVTVILLEHDGNQNQEEFEQSLLTHSHQDLVRRVKELSTLELSSRDHEFIAILSNFYKSYRYDRFVRSRTWVPDKEKAALRSYLAKHLGVEFDDNSLVAAQNGPRFRRFIGNIVGKISTGLYAIASARSESLGLNTHERRADSKAAKIFLQRRFTFQEEDVLIKELLVFFMSTSAKSGLVGHLRSIEPLAFDPALAQDYFRCFLSEEAKQSVMSELEVLYSEFEKPGKRLAILNPIGDPYIEFDEDDTSDEDDSNMTFVD